MLLLQGGGGTSSEGDPQPDGSFALHFCPQGSPLTQGGALHDQIEVNSGAPCPLPNFSSILTHSVPRCTGVMMEWGSDGGQFCAMVMSLGVGAQGGRGRRDRPRRLPRGGGTYQAALGHRRGPTHKCEPPTGGRCPQGLGCCAGCIVGIQPSWQVEYKHVAEVEVSAGLWWALAQAPPAGCSELAPVDKQVVVGWRAGPGLLGEGAQSSQPGEGRRAQARLLGESVLTWSPRHHRGPDHTGHRKQ